MADAIDRASSPKRFGLEDLLAIHRRLMETSDAAEAGQIRTQQNWIGGNRYNPCSAAFVPPPPHRVTDLLDDLVAYLNGDEHPAVVQAAIVHAQFETIHPFIDGNGRTGRALVHVVLRRRRLAPRFVPPISLILATWAQTYVGGLTTFRHLEEPDSPQRSSATHEWLQVFATAANRASADATRYARDIFEIEGQWRERLGAVRANSTTDLLLRLLPGVPLLTVQTAAALTQRSEVAASTAIGRLTDAGVLVQRNIGRHRYRVFEAPDVIGLFTALERSLASETGDTLSAPPVRRVPRRPT
jgi:Fic family protein